MKMKNKLALLAAAAAMVWLPLQAAAAYETSAYIPATIQLSGFDRGEFALELTALEGAPAPKEYILRRSGAGEVLFGPIVYSEPGVYRYHVEQNPGEDAGIEYDGAQYEATVFVENDGTGGLTSQVSAVRLDASAGGEAVKSDIVFLNRRHGGSSGGGGGSSSSQEEAKPAAAAVTLAAPAKAPKTGDMSQLGIWVCLLAGSLAAVAGVRHWRKR